MSKNEKILVLNIATDSKDTSLGFAISWLNEFSKDYLEVDVITLNKGDTSAVNENINIYEINKNKSKLFAVSNFYKTINLLTKRNHYEYCFSHMSAIMMLASYPVLLIRKIKSIFWYCNRKSMLCAQFFNFMIGMLGLPKVLVEQISSMTANKYILLITLIIFYMILGCFLETLSMMIATVPIIIPLILFYEIDPVWFGIFFVLIMQISLITPPVGMNLYVLQGLREKGKITDVIYGSLPFVLIMVLLIILIIIFPEIALWLPNKIGF